VERERGRRGGAGAEGGVDYSIYHLLCQILFYQFLSRFNNTRRYTILCGEKGTYYDPFSNIKYLEVKYNFNNQIEMDRFLDSENQKKIFNI